MTEKTGPRSSSDRFYNKLLLTCRCYSRRKIFLSSAIVELGLTLGERRGPPPLFPFNG